MNETLLDFELRMALGPTHAAKLLGVAWSTYCQYRNLSRALPKYIRFHVETLIAAPAATSTALIKKRVFNATRAK